MDGLGRVPKVGPIIAVEYPYARVPNDIATTMKTLYQLNWRSLVT